MDSTKKQFNYFHNHSDEEGRNSLTVCYGDPADPDNIIITTEDEEETAIECVKRLNEILIKDSIRLDIDDGEGEHIVKGDYITIKLLKAKLSEMMQMKSYLQQLLEEFKSTNTHHKNQGYINAIEKVLKP